MEKRVLLAVVLSFVVLYGYQAIFPPPKPAQSPTASAPGAQVTPAPGLAAPGSEQAEAPVPAVPAGDAIVAEQAEREIVVENQMVRAVFTNRGGVLKSWLLKHYMGPDNSPLDLVPQTVKGAVRPFSLSVDDGKMSARLANAFYKASADGLNVASAPATLTFEYTDRSSASTRRTPTFSASTLP
jgi:YidC/Oxa1 family membrane protein insertase